VRDAQGTWRVDTVRYTGRTADARDLVRAQAAPEPAYRHSVEVV